MRTLDIAAKLCRYDTRCPSLCKTDATRQTSSIWTPFADPSMLASYPNRTRHPYATIELGDAPPWGLSSVGEHLLCKQGVRGSNPLASTTAGYWIGTASHVGAHTVKDEILSYWEMCAREEMGLQRGMYFREPPSYGIILMSRRPNALYADALSADERVLTYEGHDANRRADLPDPKTVDQPRTNANGRSTENGRFAFWVDSLKKGAVKPAIFRVYEKMRDGIWTDRGLYSLMDYDYPYTNGRRVFKFRLEQANFDASESDQSSALHQTVSRQIPSSVKQQVYKRDKGRCVICNANDQLHFDHDFPYAKGGTSVLPENVRILCARHNLSKSANIE